MRESGPGVSHRGVLLALRAAAVLVIATGINDVIAGAVASYQPLYVYLAAVALVVWLDGVAIGLVAAFAAAALDALLFLRRPLAVSARVLAPFSAMVGVVIVVGVVRAIVRARRREPAPYKPVVVTPLLAPPPSPGPDMAEVLDAIEDLREELRSAVTREDGQDAEELERVRARERALAREHADAEARVIRMSREMESMHAEVLDRTARIRELETTLESERGGARGMAARVGELQAERQEMRRAIEAARTSAGAQTARADRLERELEGARTEATARDAQWSSASVDATVRTAALEAERTELRREVETARTEAAELRRELDRAKLVTTAQTVRISQAETRTAELRKELEAAREATSARGNELAALRAEHDAVREEASARTNELAELRAQHDAVREDAAARTNELAELRKQHDAVREDASARANELAELRAQLDRALADAAAKAATIDELEAREAQAAREAAELRNQLDAARKETSARANDLTQLREQLDASRLEAREHREHSSAHAARIAELDADSLAQNERIADLQRSLEAAGIDLAGNVARIAKLEHALASAHARVETLEADQKELQRELETALEDRSHQERAERDFDGRLQTIVNHLAADHEADLGKAVEEREAARAEARSLMIRQTTMQRMIEDMRAAAQKEIDRLRRRIDDLERGSAIAGERRPRVLLAYPDPEMRAAARASLERAGYEILSAADGLEALRTAMAKQPDVVIADAVMPKMDGRELCQMLKSQEKTSAIRVVLLTREGEKVPRGEHPADEVLNKPVPLEALKTTLAQLVARPN